MSKIVQINQPDSNINNKSELQKDKLSTDKMLILTENRICL